MFISGHYFLEGYEIVDVLRRVSVDIRGTDEEALEALKIEAENAGADAIVHTELERCGWKGRRCRASGRAVVVAQSSRYSRAGAVRFKELPEGTVVRIHSNGHVIDIRLGGLYAHTHWLEGVTVTILQSPWDFQEPSDVSMQVATLNGRSLSEASNHDFVSTKLDSIVPGVAIRLCDSRHLALLKVDFIELRKVRMRGFRR